MQPHLNQVALYVITCETTGLLGAAHARQHSPENSYATYLSIADYGATLILLGGPSGIYAHGRSSIKFIGTYTINNYFNEKGAWTWRRKQYR